LNAPTSPTRATGATPGKARKTIDAFAGKYCPLVVTAPVTETMPEAASVGRGHRRASKVLCSESLLVARLTCFQVVTEVEVWGTDGPTSKGP
jgi:hypothetical protein